MEYNRKYQSKLNIGKVIILSEMLISDLCVYFCGSRVEI